MRTSRRNNVWLICIFGLERTRLYERERKKRSRGLASYQVHFRGECKRCCDWSASVAQRQLLLARSANDVTRSGRARPKQRRTKTLHHYPKESCVGKTCVTLKLNCPTRSLNRSFQVNTKYIQVSSVSLGETYGSTSNCSSTKVKEKRTQQRIHSLSIEINPNINENREVMQRIWCCFGFAAVVFSARPCFATILVWQR